MVWCSWCLNSTVSMVVMATLLTTSSSSLSYLQYQGSICYGVVQLVPKLHREHGGHGYPPHIFISLLLTVQLEIMRI